MSIIYLESLYNIVIGREDQFIDKITQSDHCYTNSLKSNIDILAYFSGLLKISSSGFVILFFHDCWIQVKSLWEDCSHCWHSENPRELFLVQEDCSWWFYWLESCIEGLGCLVLRSNKRKSLSCWKGTGVLSDCEGN